MAYGDSAAVSLARDLEAKVGPQEAERLMRQLVDEVGKMTRGQAGTAITTAASTVVLTSLPGGMTHGKSG